MTQPISAMPIRVVLADDQTMFRDALATLLGLEPDIEVVGAVGRGDVVAAEVEEVRPDVVVLDLEMPGMHGIDVTRLLAKRYPSVKILVVTTFGRPGFLRRALDAGAHGFLGKETPAAELAQAIRKVAAGGHVVDPGLAAESVFGTDDPLTSREREVLRHSLSGASTADIAAIMHLSEGTVRNHVSSAIGKTGTRNRTEAAVRAEENGWL